MLQDKLANEAIKSIEKIILLDIISKFAKIESPSPADKAGVPQNIQLSDKSHVEKNDLDISITQSW